jgi:hypothetical protein
MLCLIYEYALSPLKGIKNFAYKNEPPLQAETVHTASGTWGNAFKTKVATFHVIK